MRFEKGMVIFMNQIKIIADSTCDLSPELVKEFDISIIPLCILLDMDSYADGVEISPDEIYHWADKNKKTPKTAAPTPESILKTLQLYVDQKLDIIFFGISEEMSTTCNVVRLMQEELGYDRIYVINSKNLSTGIGLQVLEAARLAKEGFCIEEIVRIVENKRDTVRASFVVDTLTYLARGGRCSQATALLANTLKLKPRIDVVDGKMIVGKKYRGELPHVVMKYAKEKEEELQHADSNIVFITHSGCDEELIHEVKAYLESLQHFRKIEITRAGGVISSHCGPGTLGILYYEG